MHVRLNYFCACVCLFLSACVHICLPTYLSISIYLHDLLEILLENSAFLSINTGPASIILEQFSYSWFYLSPCNFLPVCQCDFLFKYCCFYLDFFCGAVCLFVCLFVSLSFIVTVTVLLLACYEIDDKSFYKINILYKV